MTPTLRYGRLAARYPVELSALHHLVDLPTAPAAWTGPVDAAFDYGMLGNDSYGDCTFAGFVHLVQAVCLLLGVAPPAPGDPAVIHAYLVFTHGQDSGCVMSDVLVAAYRTGLVGQKVAGFAPSRGPLGELWQVLTAFGTGYLGVMVPAPAQGQFQADEPWDLTGTSDDDQIEGGHCVVAVSFDQNTETADVLTWGRRQVVTFRWLDRYLDEKWAVIPHQVQDAGALDSVNWDRLHAELDSLPGAVGAVV